MEYANQFSKILQESSRVMFLIDPRLHGAVDACNEIVISAPGIAENAFRDLRTFENIENAEALEQNILDLDTAWDSSTIDPYEQENNDVFTAEQLQFLAVKVRSI